MRRAEREIKSFEEIVGLVERCDTIRLGLSDEGAPYVVPLSFGYEATEGKITLYIHGARSGRKAGLLAKHPRVCAEGDVCHRFLESAPGMVTCDYESFIGYGDALPLSGAEAKKGLDLILAHCGFAGYAFDPEVLNFTAVYKIVLEELSGKRNATK